MSDVILVVDDSSDQLETVKQYLQAQYTVVCCEAGIKAIIYLKENPAPALILLDIEMPMLDGYATLERIREMEKGVNIPIIGLTGRNSKSSVLKFISKGGNNYLVKPITKAALLENVEKYISAEARKQVEQKILVVDDDLTALRIMQDILMEQYNVTTLSSCKLAIEYLKRFKPDLILLDYRMTPYSGISVFHMIQKMDGLQNVPVIFVTGETDREILLEITALKPADIILKPFNKDEFLHKVKQVFCG